MYNRHHHLHFIGIGGVGMAGIAEVLLNLGYSVSGSDLRGCQLIDHLRELGASISLEHSPRNIPEHTSVVVISSAVKPLNPELVGARERHIPVIPRAEMLGELMRMKYGIGISGSHGKTTTTSMIAKVLGDCGFDPTVIIGGRIRSEHTGARLGLGDYLVAEADESDGSFCLLRPAISVVTNIDREHLGYYGSFGGLESAFHQFMGSVPFYGLVVACFDDSVIRRLCGQLKRRVCSYGIGGDFNLGARDIVVQGQQTTFDLYESGIPCGRFGIPVPGSHMVSNALAAIGVGLELGAPLNTILGSLGSFQGVSRRSEVISETEGVVIIDDYAHHPTEIMRTLSAIRRGRLRADSNDQGEMQNSTGRMVVLFQPHRYSRTQELSSDFVGCFADADEVIVGEIYSAGEDAIPGISGEKLARALEHPRVSYVANLSDAVPGVASKLQSGDVVVTLGAGSIGSVAHRLAEHLSR